MLVTSHTISSAELHHAAGLLDPLFSEELFCVGKRTGSLPARNKGSRQQESFPRTRITGKSIPSPPSYSNLFDLSQLVRPYLVRYLLLAQHVHPDRFSTNEAVDRTRALGQDALIKLVGHYPWFEKIMMRWWHKLYRQELNAPATRGKSSI